MNKKVVAINAGPRINWNTDTLLNEAIRGIQTNNDIVKRFDLYKLDKYTGCISCFACKKERFKGHCAINDGLTPVLDAIREADGLIIASPNYLSDFTAAYRALYERLIFQNLTYNIENYSCNERKIPVLLIMTSNANEDSYKYLLENYKKTFENFIGPTKYFISGNTLQIKDYSKTDWPWTLFDAENKYLRHENIFPLECKKVYELGKELLD